MNEQLYEAIQAEADRQGVSVASVIEDALESHLNLPKASGEED